MNAANPAQAREPVRIGVSSCLLGHAVRYESGHKHNAYITQTLGRFFDFTPFCPEVAIGLGVPRAPIRPHPRELMTVSYTHLRAHETNDLISDAH